MDELQIPTVSEVKLARLEAKQQIAERRTQLSENQRARDEATQQTHAMVAKRYDDGMSQVKTQGFGKDTGIEMTDENASMAADLAMTYMYQEHLSPAQAARKALQRLGTMTQNSKTTSAMNRRRRTEPIKGSQRSESTEPIKS